MKNVFIGMLVLMAVSLSNAAVIRDVTATASDEYISWRDPYTWWQVNGVAENVVNGSGFDEYRGFHYNDGALKGVRVTPAEPELPYVTGGNMWIAPMDPQPWIRFTLQSPQRLSAIKVWNANSSSFFTFSDNDTPQKIDRLGMGVKQMQVVLYNGSQTPVADLGTIPLDKAPGRDDVDFGQVIPVSGIYDVNDVQYVQFNILSNHGDSPMNKVGLAEVRFYNDVIVPEVSVGDDQTVQLSSGSAGISLDGTVSYNGSEQLTTTWYVWPEDPNVVISDANSVDTTASINGVTGTFYFSLVASDGAYAVDDYFKVKVLAEGSDGLLSHWTFDEGSGTTAADSGPLANTLSINLTGLEWSSDAALGNASMQFGSLATQYVLNIPNPSYYNQFVYDFSAALWFKTTNPSEFMEGLIDKGNWRLYMMGDRLQFEMTLEDGQPYAGVSSTKINDGQWHFAALTYDGYSIKLYIDSRLEAQVNSYYQAMFFGDTSFMRLGGHTTGGGVNTSYRWNGMIDDVKIYEVCLTGDQISAAYSAVNNPCASLDLLGSDINYDCQVDLADFASLAGNWLDCSNVVPEDCF